MPQPVLTIDDSAFVNHREGNSRISCVREALEEILSAGDSSETDTELTGHEPREEETKAAVPPLIKRKPPDFRNFSKLLAPKKASPEDEQPGTSRNINGGKSPSLGNGGLAKWHEAALRSKFGRNGGVES